MNEQKKLIGMLEIQAFTEKSDSTLLDWRRDFKFPMQRENAIWTASPVEIMAWFSERGCDPDSITSRHLKDYAYKQARKAGTAHLYNKQLKGVKAIRDFLDLSQDAQILDLMRQFPATCPIKKVDGVLAVDADKLMIFIENYVRPAGVFI
ncbi:MAG: hypothetical protein WA081_05425 [Desulfosalsimonadaceae bacterium]